MVTSSIWIFFVFTSNIATNAFLWLPNAENFVATPSNKVATLATNLATMK